MIRAIAIGLLVGMAVVLACDYWRQVGQAEGEARVWRYRAIWNERDYWQQRGARKCLNDLLTDGWTLERIEPDADSASPEALAGAQFP